LNKERRIWIGFENWGWMVSLDSISERMIAVPRQWHRLAFRRSDYVSAVEREHRDGIGEALDRRVSPAAAMFHLEEAQVLNVRMTGNQ